MLQRQGQSDTDLLQALRKASSELSSPVNARRRRHGAAASSIVESASHVSGRRSMLSDSSYSSSYSKSAGMSLRDMQKQVQNAAMERYISSLEKEAKEASADGNQWRKTIQGSVDMEKTEKARRRELAEQNQIALRSQIENNKSRRAEQRRSLTQDGSMHSFPLFTETFISEDEVAAYRKDQKKALREELDQQMETTKLLRGLEEKKHADIAVEKQAENLEKMMHERGVERDRRSKMSREIVKEWDRDVRMRSLKKAIETNQNGGHPVKS